MRGAGDVAWGFSHRNLLVAILKPPIGYVWGMNPRAARGFVHLLLPSGRTKWHNYGTVGVGNIGGIGYAGLPMRPQGRWRRDRGIFQTGLKKPGRGMARASRDLIDAMYAIAKAAQPITGRGVGYKLFTRGLIKSMSVNEYAEGLSPTSSRARRGTIPWSWIVDETRELERVSTWSNTAEYAQLSRHPIVAIFGTSNRLCQSMVREGNNSRRITACVITTRSAFA